MRVSRTTGGGVDSARRTTRCGCFCELKRRKAARAGPTEYLFFTRLARSRWSEEGEKGTDRLRRIALAALPRPGGSRLRQARC